MYVPLQFYTKGSVKLDPPYAAGGSSARRLSFICGPVSTLEYCAHHFIFRIFLSATKILGIKNIFKKLSTMYGLKIAFL